jgi:hypothetical protein
MRIVILLLTLLSIISCSKNTEPTPVTTLPPTNPDGEDRVITPIKAQAFEVKGTYNTLWPKEWTRNIFSELEDQNSSLLKIDVSMKDLARIDCREYPSLDREEKKMFWALFISSIAHFESNYNPNTRYWESGLGKYSEGLLQLSVDDGNNHDFCELSNENILRPFNNLKCGVSILSKQVEGSRYRESGILFPNKYYYWSVLTRAKTREKLITFFKTKSRIHLPFCLKSK